MNNEETFIFKIIVLGDDESGKTSLLKKYTIQKEKKNYLETLGTQFSRYPAKIKGEDVILFFWDVNADKEFEFFRPTFYKGAKAAILIFSDYHRDTINKIKKFYIEIKRFCGRIPIILLRNNSNFIKERERLEIDEIIQHIIRKRRFFGFYRIDIDNEKIVFDVFRTLIKELYNQYGLSS